MAHLGLPLMPKGEIVGIDDVVVVLQQLMVGLDANLGMYGRGLCCYGLLLW